ncbi:hypothetical protein KM043_017398 [Ampulex compressa]|nr:hypothetical protein KM043_017398 [Ampulex compressa]
MHQSNPKQRKVGQELLKRWHGRKSKVQRAREEETQAKKESLRTRGTGNKEEVERIARVPKERKEGGGLLRVRDQRAPQKRTENVPPAEDRVSPRIMRKWEAADEDMLEKRGDVFSRSGPRKKRSPVLSSLYWALFYLGLRTLQPPPEPAERDSLQHRNGTPSTTSLRAEILDGSAPAAFAAEKPRISRGSFAEATRWKEGACEKSGKNDERRAPAKEKTFGNLEPRGLRFAPGLGDWYE